MATRVSWPLCSVFSLKKAFAFFNETIKQYIVCHVETDNDGHWIYIGWKILYTA